MRWSGSASSDRETGVPLHSLQEQLGQGGRPFGNNKKESGSQGAHWRTSAESHDGHIAPERRRSSLIINQEEEAR